MRFLRWLVRWPGTGYTVVGVGILCIGLIPMASASGLYVSRTLSTYYGRVAAPYCGSPVSLPVWTDHRHLRQQFQHCQLRARLRILTPTAFVQTPLPRPTLRPSPTVIPTAAPSPMPWPTPIPSATPDTSSPTLYVLSLINGSRAGIGAPALALDSTESACAYAHSQHMSAEGFISHDQFPGDICIPFFTAGENVGQAFSPVDSGLLLLHQQMMAEPGWAPGCTSSHVCNILYSGYHRVGIGVYVSADGRVWLTEDFTN